MSTRMVEVRAKVLKQNDLLARALREKFRMYGVCVVGLVSSPGSGKTAFLEKLLAGLAAEFRVAALVGDLATENDAARLKRATTNVKQITTGTICHLDAQMIETALEASLDLWQLDSIDFLFIENVGNLVCPSSYDLGEELRMVLLSATEGEDKPLKYPSIFFKSDLFVLTKIDLLPYVPFNADVAEANARLVHPGIEIVRASSTAEGGLDAWLAWLKQRMAQARQDTLAPAGA